jgi:hypothetical protein
VFVGALAWPAAANAELPTTRECLSASEAWISAAKQHHPRAARDALVVCAAQSCPEDVRKECAMRLASVTLEVPTIVFEATDAHGKPLSAVRVSMDGERLAEQLDGTPLAVEPGEHRFTFESRDAVPQSRSLVIVQGQTDRHEAISLLSAGSAPPAGRGDSTRRPDEPFAGPDAPPGAKGLGPQRVLAIAAAGVSVVGLAIGAGFGISMLAQKSSASAECPNLCPTQAGVDAWNSAAQAGDVASVALVVGAVGAVAATTLWLTAPVNRSKVAVGLGPATLQVRGVW